MSPGVLLAVVAAYFGLLLWVARRTARGADNQGFFIGNRSSHWLLVAFGMVGTSLSGVTFVSVPGAVGATSWHYLQIVIGQVIGYALIAGVLLPLYYRLGLTSIYAWLRERIGPRAHRTGAGLFIAARTLGASARLYLVVRILQDTLLDRWGLPFWLTAAVILALIVAYTIEGGVKTIVWTDTLQTAGMLFGLVMCIAFLLGAMGLGPVQGWDRMRQAGLASVWVDDAMSRDFWLKQVAAGAAIALAMTGIDQEMMQKNISVRTLRDSQKNVLLLSLVMVVVVAAFLYLGALLQLFATQSGLAARGDRLFPAVVMAYLPAALQLTFIVALISALFPSADGAMTALTSSFCIDLLGLPTQGHEARVKRIRQRVHLGFALLFMALVLVFRIVDDPSMIGLILKLAGYTYGPLLGLFAFGLLTRRTLRDAVVPWVVIGAPALGWLIDTNQAALMGRYEIGLELLLLNALFTFGGLCLLSARPAPR
ncbi:MAG: sodium:solute symporter [Burkholderiales bacterium]|nr:sodium:solute symporter [Burkholderiales bacterium]